MPMAKEQSKSVLTSTDLRAVQHAGTSEGSAVVAGVGEIQSRITTGAIEDVQKGKNKDVCSAIGTVRSEVLSEKVSRKKIIQLELLPIADIIIFNLMYLLPSSLGTASSAI